MPKIAADASKIIEGGKLMVWVGKASIAMATNHTLTLSTETNEISNKDLGAGNWTANSIRRFSWEVSSDNMFTMKAYKKLFETMTNKTLVTLTFGKPSQDTLVEDPSANFADWTWSNPSTGTTTGDDVVMQGQAYITNLDLQAPNDDNATFSVTFTGVGELTMLS